MTAIEQYSLVALLHDLPEHALVRGQVGTVVELLSPAAVIVEFTDLDGELHAQPLVYTEHLMRLHYEPVN